MIVRHAQAEHVDDLADVDRALTPRGRRDAAALGRWLAERVGPPDLVLCSSARRTVQTWQLAAAVLSDELSDEVSDEVQVHERDDLYLGSAGTLLAATRAVPADVRTLVLVGHEPVQSTLAQALAGPGSSPAAVTGMAAGFSTGAAAVLDVEGPWDALQPHGGRLVAFTVPRG